MQMSSRLPHFFWLHRQIHLFFHSTGLSAKLNSLSLEITIQNGLAIGRGSRFVGSKNNCLRLAPPWYHQSLRFFGHSEPLDNLNFDAVSFSNSLSQFDSGCNSWIFLKNCRLLPFTQPAAKIATSQPLHRLRDQIHRRGPRIDPHHPELRQEEDFASDGQPVCRTGGRTSNKPPTKMGRWVGFVVTADSYGPKLVTHLKLL